MMRIVEENRGSTNYGSLEVGDVFSINNLFYIKTNIPEEDCSEDLIAVNLRTGTKLEIGSKVEVRPVKAELHIL